MTKSKETLFQKIKAEHSQGLYEKSEGLKYSAKIRYLIIISVAIISSLFFWFHLGYNLERNIYQNFLPGYIWNNQTIKAEFTFPIYRDKSEIEEDIKKAISEAPLVFTLNKTAEIEAKNKLDTLIEKLKSPNFPETNDLSAIFTESALRYIKRLSYNQREYEIKRVHSELNKFLFKIYNQGFINISVKSIQNPIIVVKIHPNSEIALQTQGLYDSLSYLSEVNTVLKRRLGDSLMPLVSQIASKIMFTNLNYSKILTEQSYEFIKLSIPKTKGIVRRGEIIVNKGDKLTNEQIEKLKSYIYSQFIRQESGYSLTNYLGSLLHASLVYLVLLFYLFLLRKRIYYDNSQLLILSLIIVFVALQSWLTQQIPTNLPIEYLILIPSLSMLVAIVFDSRTAFYTTVTMALLIAGIRGNDYETSTAMLIAGSFAAYSVRDIQSRTQIYFSFVFIAVCFVLIILAFSLERSTELSLTINRIIFALINSAIAPLVTFGLLFIIERTTNIATDLRIKEFDNLNHPLLNKLSEIAPGTYQHTLTVAIIAEKSARAIGANPLLTRVGTYFHDIGKINKPEYFVENQIDSDSKHDLISPKKSATAIREHVLDGIELARQYKLPQRLIDFIPMHHGTTLIKHFYAKALEEQNKDEINQEDYRYPGPKPNSKETAILMICDTAEAISKISGIDRESFEDMLKKIVYDRILDGQFDECNITMNEISIIIETCTKNLMGVTHQRKPYKEIPPNDLDTND